MKALTRFALTLALCAALLPGLARQALAGELIVSGAASLTDAMTEVKKAFEKANPAVKITTNFAASGTLLKQIEQGAPVDVFASADQKSMDQAVEKNLIDTATRVNFTANSLALIVPADSKANLASAADLAKPAVAKIAIGNPEIVPVGRYTMESLTSMNLVDALKAKFINADSVRQALDYCVRGEVDAAVVFGTDAKIAGDKVKIVATLAGHKPISYPVAIVSASKNKKDAAAFIAFLTSKAGADILSAYGFKPVAGK